MRIGRRLSPVMRRHAAPPLLLLALLGPVSAQSEDGSSFAALEPAQPEATELDPMIVTPRANPLDESLERLRRMMEDAPCLGCGPEQDAARASPYGRIGKIITALTGLGVEPPNPDLEQRRETRVAEEWRVSEYGPEMEGFR